jgi:hypothetical protein
MMKVSLTKVYDFVLCLKKSDNFNRLEVYFVFLFLEEKYCSLTKNTDLNALKGIHLKGFFDNCF